MPNWGPCTPSLGVCASAIDQGHANQGPRTPARGAPHAWGILGSRPPAPRRPGVLAHRLPRRCLLPGGPGPAPSRRESPEAADQPGSTDQPGGLAGSRLPVTTPDLRRPPAPAQTLPNPLLGFPEGPPTSGRRPFPGELPPRPEPRATSCGDLQATARSALATSTRYFRP